MGGVIIEEGIYKLKSILEINPTNQSVYVITAKNLMRP